MSLYNRVSIYVIILVQNLDPCACECEDCGYFFRAVLSIGVGCLTIAGSIAVLIHYFYFVRKRTVSVYEEIDEDPNAPL